MQIHYTPTQRPMVRRTYFQQIESRLITLCSIELSSVSESCVAQHLAYKAACSLLLRPTHHFEIAYIRRSASHRSASTRANSKSCGRLDPSDSNRRSTDPLQGGLQQASVGVAAAHGWATWNLRSRHRCQPCSAPGAPGLGQTGLCTPAQITSGNHVRSPARRSGCDIGLATP